jgi:hypothetical protein
VNKLRKTLRVALLVGFVVSLSLWLILVVNGELVPSGQSGLLAQVHRFQQPGSNIAHTWFPCGDGPEAVTPGCQYLKIAPATILLNAILFAGVLFIPVYIFRLFSTSLD